MSAEAGTLTEGRTDQPDWSDFEPTTERDHLAYSLMTAGVTVDPADSEAAERGLVNLDYGLADMVLEDLHHRGMSVAALAYDTPDEPEDDPRIALLYYVNPKNAREDAYNKGVMDAARALQPNRVAEDGGQDNLGASGESGERALGEARLDLAGDGVQPFRGLVVGHGGHVDDNLDVGSEPWERVSGHADKIQPAVSNVNRSDGPDRQ